MSISGSIRESLNAFRRKYYMNEIIRGSIILLLFISILFLTIIFGESSFHFSVAVRTILFFGLLATFLGVLIFKIGIPLLKLANIGKVMSDTEAAAFIGKHINGIDDKLLNTVQLMQLPGADQSLLSAAIESKTAELKVFSFARAVSFKANYSLAKYLTLPALVIIGILLIQPDVLTQSSYRLVNYGTDFPPPPPFYIRVDELPDRLEEGKSLDIIAETQGKEVPSELFIFVNRSGSADWIPYPMQKKGISNFQYELDQITEDVSITVGNAEVKSQIFHVKVWKAPGISRFTAIVQYPAYTGKKSDTLPENVGDFSVLKGSYVTWKMQPRSPVDNAQLIINQDFIPFKKLSDQSYITVQRVSRESDYRFQLKSNNISNQDTTQFHILVEEDRYPTVLIRKPSPEYQLPVSGVMPLDYDIGDDYGISKAQLLYRYTRVQSGAKVVDEYQVLDLPFEKSSKNAAFNMDIDFGMMGIQTGDEVEYFIKVWDNDAVNGPKMSQSLMHKLVNPSVNDLYEEANKNTDEIAKQLEDIAKDAQKLNKEYEKFQKKLIEKKSLDYDDKKELKQMIEKQSTINESLNQVQEKLDKNKQQQKDNNLITPETLKKLEKLQDLVKELQSPELNEYLKKLQEEMEKLRPEDLKREMEQTKLDREQLQKDIERAMDMFKQFQAEQKAQELMKKVDNLKERQDQLRDKTNEKNSKEQMDALQKKQEELNKEMEELKKEVDALKELKKETSTPQADEMKKLEDTQKGAKDNMDAASEQMKENKSGKASDSQKEASDKMQEMKDQLDSMAAESEAEQDAENLEDLRDILENLIKISFEQEDLRDMLRTIRPNDPSMNARAQDQRKIQDDMQMLKDSLYALASRVADIKKFVTDEVTIIQKSVDRSIYYIGERNLGMAGNDQQMAMTSMNNLANMLSDALENMMQQMKKKGQPMSQGMCKKPGGKKPNMMKLGQQQKEVNQKLNNMMKLGKMDPKELGRMAAEQEMIRQQMKEAQEQLEEEGKPGLGDMKKVEKDMEQTEQEMINNMITQETLLRQQKILNRMLDATKSVRERDMDEERKSTTARELDRQSPAELTEKEKQDRLRYELLKSLEAEYNPALKTLIEQYFQEFGKR